MLYACYKHNKGTKFPPYRSSTEAKEGHLPLQVVSCEGDGFVDVAQLSTDVKVRVELVHILRLQYGFRKHWALRQKAKNH